MRRVVRMPSVQNVAAGATATLSVPTDRRIHSIMFQGERDSSGAQPISEFVSEIRVKIDGKVQRRASPAELIAMNNLNSARHYYDGIAGQGPLLAPVLYFSEPWRRSAPGEDALAWGLSDVATMEIEMDIQPAKTPDYIRAFAVVDNVQEGIGAIIKHRKQTISANASGELTVSTLPKRSGSYVRMHAFSEHINKVTVQVDQNIVYEVTKEQNEQFLKRNGFRYDANRFDILFDATRRVSDSLPLVKADGSVISEFRIDFDMAQADDFVLLSQILGTVD